MKERPFRKPLLSRKVRTLIYALIILLALTAVLCGSFPITPRSAFRLAEKAQLATPGQILGTEFVNSMGQNAVIIAENEDLCMTYSYRYLAWADYENLVCKKKTGDLTFLSMERAQRYSYEEDQYAPIILFDSYPQAVRAELEIDLSMDFSGTIFQNRYAVTADRTAKGYFLFRLNWRDPVNWTDYPEWSVIIHSFLKQMNQTYPVLDPAPARIRLYDRDGTLILDRQLDLTAP